MGKVTRIGTAWALVTTLVFSLSAHAGNRHEHFQGLFTFDHLLGVYGELRCNSRVTGYSLGAVSIDDISLARLWEPQLLTQIFGAEAMARVAAMYHLSDPSPEALRAIFQGRPLGKIAKTIARANVGVPGFDFETVRRSFFEFTPASRHDLGAYRSMESARTELLLAIDRRVGPERFAWFWQEVVGRYSEGGNVTDKTILDLALPWEFFRPELVVATQAGTHARVSAFLSIPRRFLLEWSDAELEAQFSKFRELRDAGWAIGIDVSGSMYERDVPAPAELRDEAKKLRQRIAERQKLAAILRKSSDPKLDAVKKELDSLVKEANRLEALAAREERDEARYKARLQRVFSVVAERSDGQVRVHAHEAARQGAFYRALRASLREPGGRLPARIRIGHINTLSADDIAFYSRLPHWLKERLLFEANPVSNHFLHGTPVRSLVRTLHALVVENFSVVLGADEGGILGSDRASLPATLKLLERNGAHPALIGILRRETRALGAQHPDCVAVYVLVAGKSRRPFPPPGTRYLEGPP